MMSKLVNGLFFAGEVMDIDGETAGSTCRRHSRRALSPERPHPRWGGQIDMSRVFTTIGAILLLGTLVCQARLPSQAM